MHFRGERWQDMNYNKLWKLLIDRKLKKKDLREMAGLSTNVMTKMGKDGDVSTQLLRKISEALNVKVEDIVDFANVYCICKRQGGDLKKVVRETYDLIGEKISINEVSTCNL